MNDRINTYITGIDHVGVAVPVIEDALEQYLPLGYQIVKEPTIDADREIRVCFIRLGNMTVELVSPMEEGKKSPVDSFLDSKRGYVVYHICYLVSDIEKQIEIMKNIGYMMLHVPAPSQPMGGRRVAYLYNRRMGLVEIVENKCT